MTGITDLAVETRLQIYERLLKFKRPLRRIHRNKDSHEARPFYEIADEDGDLYRKTDATALLFVNKQISGEALATFYKLNTIVLRHADICASSKRDLTSNTSLVHRAIVSDPVSLSKSSRCSPPCDTSLYGLIWQLTHRDLPKLRSVMINTSRVESIDELRKQLRGEDTDDEDESEDEHDLVPLERPPLSAGPEAWADYTIRKREQARVQDARNVERDLEEYLRSFKPSSPPEMDIQFTGVGCCKVVGEDINFDITLLFTSISKAWEYYGSLHWTNHNLCPNCDPKLPAAIDDVPFPVWRNVQILFRARLSWMDHACTSAHAAKVGIEIQVGRWKIHNVRDLRPGMWDALMWERTTEMVMTHM